MPAAAANRVRNIMIAITQGIGPDSRPSGSKRRLAERLPCFLPHGTMFSLRPAQCHARPFVADAADNAAARSDRTIAPCPVASFARPPACSANECHGSLRRHLFRVYSYSPTDSARAAPCRALGIALGREEGGQNV